MLFNSIDFAIFLPIVFILYWFVTNKSLKLQNLIVVFSSYFFYGCWDWRFLALIVFSTIVDYTIGVLLSKETKVLKRKILLWTSISINLGFLALFKYFNFFLDNFIAAFSFFGIGINSYSLNIILPVGISFYTFQTLSYTIDVYKRRLDPTKDIIAFSAFVSFFPQLVAGPIERANKLLPQFNKKREFNYYEAVDGMRQILWGLFKKIVVADNCAQYANEIFNNSTQYGGSSLFIGALFFTFQIYGDFSGYSDIAIGTSRLFGFNLMQNFAFPYFSRDIAEFWRRWHISLSTWFRDYLYIPLGGSRGGIWIKTRNTFIIFIVSGFWHGANWTFIVWGTLNAIFFLPILLAKNNRKNLDTIAQNKYLPSIKEFSSMTLTFGLTVFAWIFFRADNIGHALSFVYNMFTGLTSYINYSKSYQILDHDVGYPLMLILILFIIIEWIGRGNQYAIERMTKIKNRFLRWSFYFTLIGIIIISAISIYSKQESQFIYFQF